LGILPGVIGLLQATEAIKLIAGIGDPLIGRLLHFDALAMKFREFKVRRNPKCPVCGDNPTIKELIDYEQFCGVGRGNAAPAVAAGDAMTVEDLKRRIDSGEELLILDVRNPDEFQIGRIPGTTLLPLPELAGRLAELPRDREIIVHCKSGMRSAKAQQLLKDNGFSRVVNVTGGILAWADRIDPGVPKY
jgi:adenylyltransferase/sulfurtransferase